MKTIKIAVALIAATLSVGCFNKDSRNYEFFPDMYESVGYETYGEYEAFGNGQQAQIPVEGTIARGWKPYAYPNTTEGFAQAKEELKNPLPYTEDNLNKGKELYTIYCAICHGDKGDGKGNLVKREKILGIPSYDDMGRAITEGGVYHVSYYGLNTMGSYAAQTNEEERWQITHYVMDLKAQLEGKPKRAFETKASLKEQKEIISEVTVQENPVTTTH
ncbi:mono/diheme cytochrome c family protein [Mesonia hippocampi]|uniref:Mono/diheme cytochrome c family protein n=1 Tax=Mesonia hippocampi TaxID=1628250 RepID=A0A840ENW9_9FLAO|nr:cytochrome c [Mesonia hippocampi]MBB4118795.1 mono/diheme cytochrome c family protein [Mesonia hippocampi]